MEIRANEPDAADLSNGESAFKSGHVASAYQHLLRYCERHKGAVMSPRAESLYAKLLAADLIEEMAT